MTILSSIRARARALTKEGRIQKLVELQVHEKLELAKHRESLNMLDEVRANLEEGKLKKDLTTHISARHHEIQMLMRSISERALTLEILQATATSK